MTVLLVLFTLIIFLVADYVVQKARLAKVAERSDRVAHGMIASMFPGAMSIPNSVELATNHTWLKEDPQGVITLGVDEFLAGLLGAVEDIVLPPIGNTVTPAVSEIALRHAGKSLDLASPVVGQIVEVNDEVRKNPALAREDPYGAGWLIKLARKRDREVHGLFVVPRPVEWLKKQMDLAKEFFTSRVGSAQLATMYDGGVPVEGLLRNYDAETWKEFSNSFAMLRKSEQQ